MSRFRWLKLLPLVGFTAFVGVLSLGDRSPGIATRRWRSFRRLAHRVEVRFGVDYVDRGDLPFAGDKLGHLGLYVAVGFLAVLTLKDRLRVVTILAGVIAFSAVVELIQPQLSATRNAEFGDLIANSIGATLGVVAALLATRVVDLVSRRTLSL